LLPIEVYFTQIVFSTQYRELAIADL